MQRTFVTAFALAALASLAGADQVTLVASQDNTIYSESGSTSNGAGSFLFAGKNSMSNTRRALVRFDITGSIPAGAIITSVRLQLHVSQQNAGAETCTVHRVSASWGEGASDAPGSEGSGTAALANDATWTDRFFGAAQPWMNVGGDFSASASTSLAIDGLISWQFPSSAAIVADVQQMRDLPSSNFGWIVRGNESAASSAKRFDSRQNIDSSVWPRLIVDYTPPCFAPTSYCIAAPNSVGPGATLASSGTQSVAANDFVIIVSGVPTNASGLFFFGPTPTQTPFGDGFRCVGGQLRRLGVQQASGGLAARALDFTAYPASDITSGSTWNFQFWYRDPAQNMSGFNLSDGGNVQFCP